VAVVTPRFVSVAGRRAASDWPLALADAGLVAGAWVAALALRYDGSVPAHAWAGLWTFLPVAVLIALGSNVLARLYSGVWRHASLYEARRLVAAHVANLFLTVPLVLALGHTVPLSVPLIAAPITVGLLGAVRFRSRLLPFRRTGVDRTPKIVVLGAGAAGAELVRDVHDHPGQGQVVGYLDDDPRLQGRRVQGVPVIGIVDTLPAVVEAHRISYAVLAMPSATAARVRSIASLAEQAGTVLRVVPPLSALVHGRMTLQDIRDLEISDLLGRGQVETDLVEVLDLVQGQCVLVTGAGGSIGSEIARQVSSLGARRVVLLDHDETHLFDTAADLPRSAVQRLADIRDTGALEQVFADERPDMVFHAAAHKHVPLLEEHPVEAVQTNVLGTRSLVTIAEQSGVRRFVFISTDKAVRPSSVMGATKNLGERVVLSATPMTTCAVRFGNVLGSRGSVVPTFVTQIRAGGPVTVTDARMTRYFMSIPEAVRLVLHAAALAEGGEIFMLDMGQPMRILDLAQRMVRMSGRRPGLDVEIRVTGVRPGEKFAEELHTPDETQHPTSHPAISRLTPAQFAGGGLNQGLSLLAQAVDRRDDDEARRELFRLVTTGVPQQIPLQTGPALLDPSKEAAWT
jgi:FlaA1/EpsC-like NDP-sugar epimerase